MEIFCFLFGIAFFYTKKLILLVFLIFCLIFRQKVSLLIFFGLGFSWSILHTFMVADRNMPQQVVIQLANLEGVIDSIPTVTSNKIQFQFLITKLQNKKVTAKILLSCYQNCPKLQVGQVWRLRAKLHKPRNIRNPGGFDYVRMLASRHISWIGVVQNGSLAVVEQQAHGYLLLRIREYFATLIEQLQLDSKTLGIVQALTLGLSNHIDKEDWDLFRRTGVTHLMVISGAHIGLVAGFVYAVVRFIWCRLGKLCVLIPAQKVASCMSLIAALIYTLLAGFAVPAQRALIVCVFMLLKFISYRSWGTWQAWRYALFVVLLWEPHTVLLSGFYLSFGAVAILIAINQRFVLIKFLQAALMQFACLLGLMPLTLYCFSYGSINGFIANILAIPWVSVILVPLSLLVLFIETWLEIPGLKFLVSHAASYLLYYLSFIDQLSFINLAIYFDNIVIPISILLVMMIVVFCPLKQFTCMIMLLLITIGYHYCRFIPQGTVRVDVLDVGQGLAIVVATKKHLLIYDTGVKFYNGGDMAKLAIIPYLSTMGVKKIDKIVISHPDLDHRGGLDSLERAIPIQELIVDNPKFYHRGSSCHKYQDWVWDGVLFHFFSIKQDLGSTNNTSCVLQIANAAGKILLTGDIEEPAESYLVNTYAAELQSTVMVVPHHASKTSSSLKFLKSVNPRYAIVSYGFDNRYHLPNQNIIERYQKLQIPLYATAVLGMIQVFFTQQQVVFNSQV